MVRTNLSALGSAVERDNAAGEAQEKRHEDEGGCDPARAQYAYESDDACRQRHRLDWEGDQAFRIVLEDEASEDQRREGSGILSTSLRSCQLFCVSREYMCLVLVNLPR